MARPRGFGFPTWLKWFGLAVALLIVTLAAIFVFVADQPSPRPMTPTDVATNFQNLIGKTVTVVGDIVDPFPPQAFTVGDPTFIGRTALLVVGTSPQVIGVTIAAGQGVRVTGTVRVFHLAEIEREIGNTTNLTFLSTFEGQPVIVASRVDPA